MSEKLLIPVSIIIAGAIVGAGFYLRGSAPERVTVEKAMEQSKNIRPVTDADHLLGNSKARIIVVEYSDTECPFCKEFHTTMRKIVSDYGTKGDVAWVYRHFPIEDLHSKALKEAEALECAAELGGNAKFWEYTNRIYEITPSDDGLDPKLLTETAKKIGLSSAEFDTCLKSGKYASKVQADVTDAKNAGGDGTPYSVIVDTKTGELYPFPGAQPYENVKSILDLILEG